MDPSADLPQAVLSLLDRRYLADLRPSRWAIAPRAGDVARPLLFEVLITGRPATAEGWLAALPAVLRACHEPGHAPVLVLYATPDRHRLFVGARRLIGGGGRCTEDYLSGLAAAVKAQCSGVHLAPAKRLDPQELPDVYDFLQTAPALGVVTGIPSRRVGPQAAEAQSLDRVARAAAGRTYLLMVVAEPLDDGQVADAANACRRLKGEVHARVRRTLSRSGGETTTESTGPARAAPDPLSSQIGLVTTFCYFAGLGPVAGAARAAATLLADSPSGAGEAPKSVVTGRSESETTARETLDADAEYCERVLQEYADRLRHGLAGGFWRAAVYLAAADEAALFSAAGAARSAFAGPATPLDPIRIVRPPAAVLRPAIEAGQVLGLRPTEGPGHPLGPALDALATCVTTDELAVPFNLPRDEMPGLPMRDRGGFALTAPADGPVTLGRVFEGSGRDLGPLTLSAESLNRHVFVTGMTGYGKTTTCVRLLLDAYAKLGVPFLVVEPAKAEYARLANAPELRGRLRVFGIGPTAPEQLRLNPLAPVPGVPIGRHIDLLKAVFNASFPMHAGMPYVLEEAILNLYEDRGWRIHTGENDALPPGATEEVAAALLPNLRELHDQVEVVLARKNYAQEVHQNMGAALRSRLRSLTLGNKGTALAGRRHTPFDQLFAQPAVIQLKELGDDDEKAFVMALVFAQLYAYAELRAARSQSEQPLQHLTLIEEAHRLLTAPVPGAGRELGNPQGKAVSMFTDLLAEMRAYGEGFIIADQIPTKLAPETLKNTSLKVIHRLSAADDRAAVGRAINLSEWQTAQLNSLAPGQAVVHDERIGDAVLVRIDPVAPLAGGAAQPVRTDRRELHLHAGCLGCPRPCEFLPDVERSAPAAGPQAVFDELLHGTAERAWTAWKSWRDRARAAAPRLADAADFVFCAAAQAGYEWLGQLLADRLKLGGKGALEPRDRLRREGAARDLAPWLRDWSARPDRDPTADRLFREAGQKVRRLVAAPPDERRGCGTCPARCRMLPLVARTIDPEKVTHSLAAVLAGPGDEAKVVASALAWLTALEQKHPDVARLPDEARAHWRYCVLAQLSLANPAAQANRDAAQSHLRNGG